MKRTWIGVAGATLALVAGLGGYGWAQQTQNSTPLYSRIAIVNLAQVVKNYRKFQNFEESLKQQQQGIQKDLEGKRTQAITEQKELERPDTPTSRREQLTHDIKRLEREVQDTVEEAKQRLSKSEFDKLQETYREIREAVEAYSRKYAIEMVLQYSDGIGPDMYNPANLQHKLANHACIPMYVDPRMDITEYVTAMLNQRMASAAPTPGR